MVAMGSAVPADATAETSARKGERRPRDTLARRSDDKRLLKAMTF
jgi:hypothetical protein